MKRNLAKRTQQQDFWRAPHALSDQDQSQLDQMLDALPDAAPYRPPLDFDEDFKLQPRLPRFAPQGSQLSNGHLRHGRPGPSSSPRALHVGVPERQRELPAPAAPAAPPLLPAEARSIVPTIAAAAVPLSREVVAPVSAAAAAQTGDPAEAPELDLTLPAAEEKEFELEVFDVEVTHGGSSDGLAFGRPSVRVPAEPVEAEPEASQVSKSHRRPTRSAPDVNQHAMGQVTAETSRRHYHLHDIAYFNSSRRLHRTNTAEEEAEIRAIEVWGMQPPRRSHAPRYPHI